MQQNMNRETRMKQIASIAALAMMAGLTLAAARPAQETTYDYGLTSNEWWVAQAHLPKPVAPRDIEPGNARAPFAAPRNANGQGTN